MTEAPEEQKEQKEQNSPTWREPLLAYAALLVGLFVATVAATFWAPLSPHLLALAALFFVGIPYLILRRKGLDFHRFGIALDALPRRHILFGLAVSAVVFPLFIVGNHVWETTYLQRDLHVSADHYRQWPVELQAPPLYDAAESALQVRLVNRKLRVEVDGGAEDRPHLFVTADRPFLWRDGGNIVAIHAPPDWSGDPTLIEMETPRPRVSAEPSSTWLVYPGPGQNVGRLHLLWPGPDEDLELPRELELTLYSTPEAEAATFYVGARATPTDEAVQIRRTYWWIILWALTHLILVALPEEYFYRGYLQTRFHDLFGTSSGGPRKFLGFTYANWLTSALFALGHLVIPVGGSFALARGAVFFPSLIFGWMRERTDSIVAPVIFHASANMMVLVVAVHYF